jgi:hypothetical protein
MTEQLDLLSWQRDPVGISYSGGANSRWLVEAVINGTLPRPRHVAVFFADTGDEHEWTYEDAVRVEERCRAAGIEFIRCATHRGESLSDAIFAAARGERTRLDNPPFWTENPGGGRGQLSQKCTQIWKTRAIRRAESAWLARLQLPKRIVAWIGYGTDEQHRALKMLKDNDVLWQRPDFPAIRARLVRDQMREQLVRWVGSAPLFSACVECPFNTPLRHHQASEMDRRKAVLVDEAIREGLQHVAVEEPAFVSDRLIPLADLLRRGDRSANGAEPHCNTGRCFL